MKIIKYLILAFTLALFISCDKHEILYDTVPVDENTAEFQMHYFEPINDEAKYYIDSVYINNTLYSSVKGSGQLLPYNGIPGGATGRFFSVKTGEVNIKFYRKDKIVYDYNTILKQGKQNIFVYDLTKKPIVIENEYPYKSGLATGNVNTWDTDSTAQVKFYNFLYEDANTPYLGKLQYQYKDVRTEEWMNLGKAVTFGEATDMVVIKIIKSVHNSNGYCRVYYRALDEQGNILKVMNSSSRMVDYGDYWNGYIGRAYMHIFRGIRTAKPVSSVIVWTSL